MTFYARPQPASAAVKIVNPENQPEQGRIAPRKDSVQRHCRNIVIYGSCKYQDKGCVYHHPSASDTISPVIRSETPTLPSITADAVNAPVFVPKSSLVSENASLPPPLEFSSRQSSGSSPSPPSPEFKSYLDPEVYDEYTHDYHPNEMHVDNLVNQMEGLDQHFYEDPQFPTYGSQDGFYSANPTAGFIHEPLDYNLYTPNIPPPFVSSYIDGHFVPASLKLRQQLQERSEITRHYPINTNFPDEIQGYHTFSSLDDKTSERRKVLSWFSTIYRAVNSTDGVIYALRRIEGYRLSHHSAFQAIESWRNIRHPNIVDLHEAFTTRSFGDNSLVVVYTYHPGAETIYDAHFKANAPPFQLYRGHSQMLIQPQPGSIPERTLWSYIMQIASAMKTVHDAGLSLRGLDPYKIVVTSQNRIRLNSCGILDVLLHDTPQDLRYLQQEDLTSLGRLIFTLCCCNLSAPAPNNFQRSIDVMARMYTPEVKNAALFLISKGNAHKSIGNFIENFSHRITNEMDDALVANDRLETELMSELENARLVRLLCKFGFINERPEFARDPRWSETGDRYIIKLFRDYVFHQVDENGNPVTNLAHVLTCLNKLDAGSEERVMLVARDEQSCLVVSYREIKSCVDIAFKELRG